MPTVELVGIRKQYPGVLANDNVALELAAGEVHALLGENGAGKSTLMNILYGLARPDAGEIRIDGQPVRINTPQDAIAHGIGMVHQHFLLVPTLTVDENMVLGLPSSREPRIESRARIEQRLEALMSEYGLRVNPRRRVGQLSVGEQQRVEILRALYRGATVLILDEPTAVLTPQEVRDLLATVRRMAESGRSVVIITHKLDEVMLVADRATVLRHGRNVATVATRETTPEELARMMVGEAAARELIEESVVEHGQTETHVPLEKPIRLRVESVVATDDRGAAALKGVSLDVHAGEILGIAGVDGNGQAELEDVLTGLRRVEQGRIWIDRRDCSRLTPGEVLDRGIGHIASDRYRRALIREFTVQDNAVLGQEDRPPFRRGLSLDVSAIRNFARRLVSTFDIRTAGVEAVARTLSGGNAQKLVLARELSRELKLLIAAQPTRGLDFAATHFVRQQLREQRARGVAILLISTDLDEVLTLSDRVAVMYGGAIAGIWAAAEADRETIGRAMAGATLGAEPSGSASAEESVR